MRWQIPAHHLFQFNAKLQTINMMCDGEMYDIAAAVTGFSMILIHYCMELDQDLPNRQERRRRRWWARPYLMWDRDYAEKLLSRLHEVDDKPFFDFLRMTPKDFKLLLKWVHPLIRKQPRQK